MFLRWFSRYERTQSQVADRDRRLLVVTLHVAVAGPEASQGNSVEVPRTCLAVTLYADATGHGTVAWVAVGLSKRVFSRGLVPGPLRR